MRASPVHSLVWRIYAYAVLLLAILFGSLLLVSRLVADQTPEPLRVIDQFRTRTAEDAGLRAELAYRGGRLSAEAKRSLQARLAPLAVSFYEWGTPNAYPPALESQKVVLEGGPGGRPSRNDRQWVRLDVDGEPKGVMLIDAAPLAQHRPRPPRDRMWLDFNLPWQFGAPPPPGRFGPAGGPPPFGPPLERFMLTWLVVVGLLTVPPLYFLVIRPLKRMVQVAQRLGAGDLGTPVPIDRKDEFGELESAFEGMRQALNAQFEQRERLLRDISHELRAPLSRMAIAVPLLRADHPESPYLDQLENDLTRTDALLEEILTLARARASEGRTHEQLDLAALADELLAERALVVQERGLTLESRLAKAPVRGDRRLLLRALGNLLDNAIKYTPEGGQLRVTTGNDGALSRFCVRDDGPGIPAQALPLLFEPFYRPDTSRSRETGGTGLGLAIVKAIADSHGGEVEIRSRDAGPETGTTAELSFPQA